jgi:vacuolar-type H+-ATPase subunit C/Vma6
MTAPTVLAADRRTRFRTDLPYVCARIRARFPRLLSRGDLERVRGLRSLAEMFHDLLGTEYGPALQESFLDMQDLAEFEMALTAVFTRRVADVHGLVEQSVPAYAYLVFGEWDLHHLKSLVRRLFRKNDESAADETFVPLGTFTRQHYREAWAADSLESLCRCVEVWLPVPICALRSFLAQFNEGESQPRQIDLFLENQHFERLRACARRAVNREDAAIIRDEVALLVDMTDLRTSLRYLGRHLSRDDLHTLYLPGGSLSETQFAAMMAADAIEQVYRGLPDGPLTAAMDQAMLSFANTGRASVFERPLDEQRLRFEHRASRRCPVSVAVPLYYLSRARNEWINLKMIARGVRYGLPTGKVRENLVYA